MNEIFRLKIVLKDSEHIHDLIDVIKFLNFVESVDWKLTNEEVEAEFDKIFG